MRGKKFKLMWVKAYFEKGYALSHYFFKLIAVIGLTSNELLFTIYLIIFYTIACFVLGVIWYKYDFVLLEQEISNQNNLFVKEMRNGKI